MIPTPREPDGLHSAQPHAGKCCTVLELTLYALPLPLHTINTKTVHPGPHLGKTKVVTAGRDGLEQLRAQGVVALVLGEVELVEACVRAG